MHHKQRLCKITITWVNFHFVNVLLEQVMYQFGFGNIQEFMK